MLLPVRCSNPPAALAPPLGQRCVKVSVESLGALFSRFSSFITMYNIFQAVAGGDLARVKELLAKGGLDLAAFEPGWFKVTALFRAAQCGHLDVAKALIRAGAPLDVPGEFFSALNSAASHSHHELAAMLLREGADVDAREPASDTTPLCCAKDRRMAALLIAAGADVNAGRFRSALHLAAFHGYLDVLQELLSHPDINVNKQDEKTLRTPLHNAAHFSYSECVAALLAAGADACVTDKEGLTPLLYSFVNREDYSEFRIIAMLVTAGDRQWAHVPSPCPGLEAALLSVWTDAPQELGQLAARLEPEVKRRIRAALCVLHHASPRHLPDHIRMRLLNEAFAV
jgi:ankyrin repeat protein